MARSFKRGSTTRSAGNKRRAARRAASGKKSTVSRNSYSQSGQASANKSIQAGLAPAKKAEVVKKAEPVYKYKGHTYKDKAAMKAAIYEQSTKVISSVAKRQAAFKAEKAALAKKAEGVSAADSIGAIDKGNVSGEPQEVDVKGEELSFGQKVLKEVKGEGWPGVEDALMVGGAGSVGGAGFKALKKGGMKVPKWTRGAEWEASYAKGRVEVAAAEAKAMLQGASKEAKALAATLRAKLGETWAKGFGYKSPGYKDFAIKTGKGLEKIRPLKQGIGQKVLKSFQKSSVTTKLITAGVAALGVGVGASLIIGKFIDSYVFPEFMGGESFQNLNFAASQALRHGDEEAFDELIIAGGEVFDRSTADEVFAKFPLLRGIPAAKAYYKSGQAAWDVYKSIAKEGDLIDNETVWDNIRKKNLEAAKEEMKLFEESNARMAVKKEQAGKDYLSAKTAQEKEDRRLDLEMQEDMIKLYADAHKAKIQRNKDYWKIANKIRQGLMKSQLKFGLLG